MLSRLLMYGKFTILSWLFLAIFVVNIFLFLSPFIGTILLLFYFFFFGKELGSVIPSQKSRFVQTLFGTWILLSLVMIVGSIGYYLFAITHTFIIVMVLLTPPVIWYIRKKKGETSSPALFSLLEKRVSFSTWIFSALLFLLFAWSMYELFLSQTVDAIRSPWEILPPSFFLFITGMILCLFFLLWRDKGSHFFLPASIIVFFSFISVTLVLFPLGYGFDAFIHKATETYIAEHGTITPKPFYYIGQYALLLFFHHGFVLPISLLDTLLLPLLSALFLPCTWFIAAVHLFKKKSLAASSLIMVFLLPLSSFIVTTPQGLANLWILITILFCLIQRIRPSWPAWPASLSAVATLLIHPMAGIPLFFFIVLLLLSSSRFSFSSFFFWIVAIMGSVILPLSFILNSFLSGQTIHLAWSWERFWDGFPFHLFADNRFHPVMDFVYLFENNRLLLLVILALLGALWYRKSLTSQLSLFFLTAGMILLNYLLMTGLIDFTFLIDYERANYSDRLIPLFLFFLSPFLLLFWEPFFERLKQPETPKSLKLFALLFLTALLVSSFYLTYPRVDIYERSHGFNVSLTDLQTVKTIEENAAGKNYVVLANQNNSTAAIKELGFKQYYGDIFFYPIPTGGPLYQLFLNMNNHPSEEVVQKTMQLVNVDQLYFVVNDYWWESERIIEQAKLSADDWWTNEEKNVTIFVYTR